MGQTRQHADREAAALQEEFGPDWKTSVWENLGWHAAIHSPCGRYHVSRSWYTQGYRYSCLLGDAWSNTGKWSGHGSTGAKAVEDCRQNALKDIQYRAALLDLGLVPKEDLINQDEAMAIHDGLFGTEFSLTFPLE